jgi:hypothetical protein
MHSVKKNPMYLYLVVLTIGSTAGLQAWTTLFNNFAVEVARAGRRRDRMIQSIREIPGFLALWPFLSSGSSPNTGFRPCPSFYWGWALPLTGWFPSLIGLWL